MKIAELSHSRLLQQTCRQTTRARVTKRQPKDGQDYDDATCYDNSLMKGDRCYLGYDYAV